MKQQRTKSQLKDFSQRITHALNLSIANEEHYHQRKEFALWLRSQELRLKSVLEKDKVGKGLIQRLFQTSNKANLERIQQSLKQIDRLKQLLKQQKIPEAFLSTTLEIPDKMINIMKQIKGKEFKKPFYAYLKGPIIMKKLIKSRQDLNNTIQKVIVNGIKFMVIQQKVCDKFQRNFLQEIFGRVFRAGGSLSIVIKIQIQDTLFEPPSSFYCYLEDMDFQSKIVWKPLANLKAKGQQIIVDHQHKTYKIAEVSILENLLSEMFVTPLQTLIPQYVIQIRQQNAFLIKHYNMDEKSRQQSTKKLKNYSSLRNPLFYFKHFISERQISIDTVKQIVSNREIYKRFFDALNVNNADIQMIVVFLRDDFWFEKQKIIVYSLAFAKQSFLIMWEVFHNIILLSKWLQQTIRPIKDTVTIYEILERFCPIFNYMSSFQASNIQQYMKFLEQLEIQSYMTTYISKTAINKYKSMLIYKQADFHFEYDNNNTIFMDVFQPLISEINFNHVEPFQMAYILNFTCKNKQILSRNVFPASWHSYKLWKQMYSQIQYQKPIGLDCYLDMMGFYLGLNILEMSQQCFQLIKHQQQNVYFMQKLQDFIKMLEKHHDECLKDEVLALLTEKAFKYRKYEIATKILSLGGTIKDYSQIFDLEFEQLIDQNTQIEKKIVISTLKDNYPQIYRKYQWEYLMRVQLKNSKGQDKPIETINYGRCWLQKQLFNTIFGDQGFLLQNVSRKDYMYGEKEISKIASSKHTQFYIEKLQYPTVPLFYSIALRKLGLSHMSSNFTLFLNEKGMFQLSQTIAKAITFKKALSQYNQNDIKLFINKNALCEAVIVSMIFMPYKLLLKDLILETSQQQSNLFIINFRQFYQSQPIIKNGSGYSLKCINCLFTMDIMHKDIDAQIIKKYYQINVDNYMIQLFEELATKVKEVSIIKSKVGKNCFGSQLTGMIFQEDFILSVTERMFKIKRSFQRCLQEKRSMNLMKLLEQISPQLCYFYEEVISSSNSLIERENLLLDEMWTKSFITETNLFSFLATTSRAQQPINPFPNHHLKFCFMGPSQSLDILKNNLKKFEVYRENFLDKNWHKQKTQTIEYYLLNIDLSLFKNEDRFKFYHTVKDKSNQYLIEGKNILPLNVIRVSSMEFLKNNKQLLQSFSYQRVHSLFLHDCQISSTTINSLIEKLDNLSYLSLKSIKSLERIEASTFQSTDIQFKNLKTLLISQCHSLQTINIKCDILEDVVIRDNQQLCDIYICSLNLRNMNCSKSPKLNFQNIGIYILKGINVLLCRSCCYGDAEKLFHDNYIIYLTNILQYLISKCQEKQSKKNIEFTLCKFDLVRQGISLNNSSILTNIFGDTSEQTAMTLAQLYLINSRINCLHINYLIQNNSIILKLISAILRNKLLKVHPIKQIIIENPKTQIDRLTEIVEACRLDKYFTITLKNLSQGNEQAESSIVKTIKSKNSSLQKMVLAIKDSKLTTKFIKNVVTQHNQQQAPQLIEEQSQQKKKITRITKIFLQKTQINIELTNITFKYLIKLVMKNCQVHSIQFVKAATALKQLKIINTIINSSSEILNETILTLQTISTFHFVQMKKKIEKIQFLQLFKTLNQLPKLQDVDFSGNDFNQNDLLALNIFFQENSTIRSLTLYQFYNKDSHINFSKFLSKSGLKAIEIEFEIEQKLAEFIQSISKNINIMRLKIKVSFQISSLILAPLKQNKTIEEVTSNQLLPMWLKQHLKQIIQNKYTQNKFEECSSFPTKTLQYYKMGLSLDGGGIRGILLAAQLEYLEKQVGYPLYKIFDYVGGTSIGGILALASTGTVDGTHTICNASDLVGMFEDYGNKIFKKDTMRQFTNLFDTKYASSGIQSVLKYYFKDCRLSQVMQQTNVLVTAVNRLDNKDVIFKSMEAILHRQKDFYMRDVGRATSAAPIYFPSAEIKNIQANVKYSLIDGGIGLNNPGKLVIDQIKKMAFNEGSQKSYFLLSLGTGRPITDIIPETAGIKDIAPIIQSFSESSSYFVQRDLRQNYKGHVIRVSPQIDLKKNQVELDRVQPQIIKYYKQLAYQEAKKQFSKTITYGRYRNKSLVDWLRQNTEKKNDI